MTNDFDPVERVKLLGEIEGLLVSLKSKISSSDKNAVNSALKKIRPRKHLFGNKYLNELSEDEIWNLYAELGSLHAQLQHTLEDSKWDTN